MPRYIHGDAMTNFSIEWLNGDFEFDLQVLWNSSDVSLLDVQGSYSSPIYLGATKKYLTLQSEPPNEFFDVDGEFTSSPSLDIDPVVKKAPVILFGTYSVDKTSFLWSGNISAQIPDVVPITPWSKSSYWSEAQGVAPLQHLPWVPRKPEVEALAATTAVSSALGVSVTSGNITIVSNGSALNWWDGKLPLAIPMPALDSTVKAASKNIDKSNKGKLKPSFSSGLLWGAILQRKDNVTLNIQGNFSAPISVNEPGTMFSIDWKKGNFSLDFKLLWNATLDGIFQDGHKYWSPVFFRATKPTDTVTDIILSMQGPGSVEGNADLQFIVSAVAEDGGLPRAPIILHGSFSPNKTKFLWFGNATVILPSPTGPVSHSVFAVVPSTSTVTASKVAVGADVIGGSIDAGAVGEPMSSMWNGDLPVPILRPDLLARGINWQGDFTSTSLTQAQLDGTFSTVLPEDSGSPLPIAVYKGKFSLQLSLLWNVSVDGLLPPGTSVYSPIYLHGSVASDDTEAWFEMDEDPSRPQADMAQDNDGTGYLTVPIILQGAYSTNRTAFWWSGRVILLFPAALSAEMKTLYKVETPMPALNKPPLANSFLTMPPNKYSATDAGPPYFKALRLGVAVRSAVISTSAGNAWNGKLPLKLPLPLFDSYASPDHTSPTVPVALPVYAHGIVWEGSLYTTSPGYLSFSGEFSLPRFVHGNGLTNFSIQWINGNFKLELQVLWNTSDISNLNIKGSYSSPVYVGARQKYSHLQDVPAGILSDASGAIKLAPSISVDPSLKKAPITLLGTYSSDGMSFIWSGNVSVSIPGVVSIPTLQASTYGSQINGGNYPKRMYLPKRQKEELSAMPSTSRALGVSVTSGNATGIVNGSYVAWWNGTLPLPIPVPGFSENIKTTLKTDKTDKGKPKPHHNWIVWNATLQRQNNVTLRLQGNFSVPIIVDGPGALFAIDWKIGNFSLDFKLIWNTSLDDIFQESRNYASPVFFRVSKPTDNIVESISFLKEPGYVKDTSIHQFLSADIAYESTFPRAPIILHGTYSTDKTKFLWSGNATVILPKPKGPALLEMSENESTVLNKSTPNIRIGAEVLDGDAVAGTPGSAPSTVWSGGIPVPIRRPNLLTRGALWRGQLTETSPTEVQLNGTFSALWTTDESSDFPFTIYQGTFSAKLGLLWNVSVNGLLPDGALVYSPIYLSGTTVLQEKGPLFIEEENDPQMLPVELAQPIDVAGTLHVPITLQGTYSPDLTTFWWTGRVILGFPQPSPINTAVLKTASEVNSRSVGATVTSGSVTVADGTQLWDGALPIDLPPKLQTVVWNGVLTQSVGGTVQLRGLFYGAVGPGEFAFVLSPLWSTPLAGLVAPGVNYTSPLFAREPTDPVPRQASSAVSGGKVPIILQGSLSPDKSSFSWSGNVILAFP